MVRPFFQFKKGAKRKKVVLIGSKIAGIYLFKVNNRDIRTICKKWHQSNANDVALVSLLLTYVSIFHTLFWCFYHRPSISKYWLGKRFSSKFPQSLQCLEKNCLLFKCNIHNSRVNNNLNFQSLKCVITGIKFIEEPIIDDNIK